MAQHYLCAMCQDEFVQTGIEVDHVISINNTGETISWDEFINRLFCEKDNMQVLCKPCHKEKTREERKK